MPRLILDAMGGDYGPGAILEGAIQALPELQNCNGELIIVGDEGIIRPLLNQRRYKALVQALGGGATSSSRSRLTSSPFQVSFIHSSEAIEMGDSIRSVRNKPNATINIGCQLAAQSYLETKKRSLEPDTTRKNRAEKNKVPSSTSASSAAFISAGHSGAIMASALLQMGRLSSVERPAIAIKLPTLGKEGCVLIDVGANVDCKPEHLRDFAVMGAIFAQIERHSQTLPRVALLSNGEEKKKGNELTRASLALIEKLECFEPGPDAIGSFMGYAEGKEIFSGKIDVMVTDGFVGNVVLKTIEGLGDAGVFSKFKKRLDYADYGAAPLLGVAGYVFICHGRSNPRAIKNALLRANQATEGRFVERLEHALVNTTR